MSLYGSLDIYATKLREDINKLEEDLKIAKDMDAFADVKAITEELRKKIKDLEDYYEFS